MKKIVIIMISIFGFMGSAFSADWSLPGITIVTRAQWGANENIRFTPTPYAQRKAIQKQKAEEELQKLKETNYDKYLQKEQERMISESRNNYLISNYSNEQKLDTSVYVFGLNNLSRPQSYHYTKNKIIIHHTAGDTSGFTGIDSVIAYIQDVYKDHTKKWGDIGYNFLIDPYGNIYEGRAGGDSVIGAHASRNNTPSIGVSLMGNFEIQKPTDAQIKSLTALVTSLAKKYSIDPLAKTDYHTETKTEPYIQSKTNYRLAGHKDAGITKCPGQYLYAQLPAIRNAVRANLQNGVLVKSVSVVSPIGITTKNLTNSTIDNKKNTNLSNTSTKVLTQTGTSLGTIGGNISLLKKWVRNFDVYVSTVKSRYSTANNIVPTKTVATKIFNQVSLNEAKRLMEGDIRVLLYELSTDYNRRDISCDTQCVFILPKRTFTLKSGIIEKQKTIFALMVNGEKIVANKVSVKDANGGLVKVNNYSRVSYAKIPRNTFSGSLSFSQESVKNLGTKKYQRQTAIVNILPFMSYLRGIAETNDTESTEKIKVSQLISKGYALFYVNGKNKHPSIPEGATYNAIDDPNSFQKYVGAGLENTLKKVYTHFEETKNKIVTYNGYLPILPYFNCSPGFTRSGKEKRGWTDTPYLVSRIDPVSCAKFEGHGVGLSGKGAQYLALQGRTAEEILKYYYPGIEIKSL